MKSIATYAPKLFGYISSVLAMVRSFIRKINIWKRYLCGMGSICLSDGSPDESEDVEVVRGGDSPNLCGIGCDLSGESNP